MKTIVLHSGGLDSSAALWLACHQARFGDEVRTIDFDYGQKQKIELEVAKRFRNDIGKNFPVTYRGHDHIDLTGLPVFDCALTSKTVAVPSSAEGPTRRMELCVVPGRNTILLVLAATKAINYGYDAVMIGIHQDDHGSYPDTRPEYFAAMNKLLALFERRPIALLAPFLNGDKAQIIRQTAPLRINFADTWTCYNPSKDSAGASIHCGRCPSCHDRKQAFIEAHVIDPTLYQE